MTQHLVTIHNTDSLVSHNKHKTKQKMAMDQEAVDSTPSEGIKIRF